MSPEAREPWPDVIDGDRVSLQRIEGAVEADWLAEAAQAVAGRAAPCRLEERLALGDVGWWIRADDEIVGALSGCAQEPKESGAVLVWTWLAIDARWRAYGFGGAAVPLFESAARQLGAANALAPLPADNGVALYFWLRLGYTPLRASSLINQLDVPGVTAETVWMQRALD